MLKERLQELLLNIDEEVGLTIGARDPKPALVIVGGAAFLLRDITVRQATHDVDVLQADEELRAILANYPEVNGRVAAFSDQIPYNFEDRLTRLDIGTQAIDILTPSVEDLVVMKLYAQRPNDLQDIDGAVSSGKLDWRVLEHLVMDDDEAAASCLSERRYGELVRAYEALKARWGR